MKIRDFHGGLGVGGFGGLVRASPELAAFKIGDFHGGLGVWGFGGLGRLDYCDYFELRGGK